MSSCKTQSYVIFISQPIAIILYISIWSCFIEKSNTEAHVSTWGHTWRNIKYNWLFGANFWLTIKSLCLSQKSHDLLEVWLSLLSPPSLVIIYNRPDWATVSWVVELKAKKVYRVIFTLCVLHRNWAFVYQSFYW